MGIFSLNLHGRLVEFDHPAVMGIINVTPDSFYAGSRVQDNDAIRRRVAEMVAQGADMIDIGGYSSRPGSHDISESEELERIKIGMEAIREVAPEIPVSVDTFRSSVARYAVEELTADMINDISGGNIDNDMIDTVASLGVPYILMHMRGTPSTMQEFTCYNDVTSDVLAEIGERLQMFALRGVNDVIIDPGFGFSKTLEQNYRLLRDLEVFKVLHRPVLVGVSRKSMITRLLGISTDNALNGTTVINTVALQKGAAILRVHDVEAAVQAVKIVAQLEKH